MTALLAGRKGAAFAGMALIDRFEQDITAMLQTGDQVEIDPPAGRVTVWRRGRG